MAMSDISVLGCGRMGSALIQALAASDFRVTIWNRTREKAEKLTGQRVSVAETVADALSVSPTTIICISNYPDTEDLLNGHENLLQDNTILQLCSGRPDEAQALSERVTAAGGTYVDGSILNPPQHIGTESALIFYAGDEEAFRQLQPVIEAFGGAAEFFGENPRAAAVREWALGVPYSAMMVGLSLGGLVCEREGVSLEWYAETLQEQFPTLLKGNLKRIQDSDSPTDPKEREDVRLSEGEADMATYLKELDIDPRIHEVIHELHAAGLDEVPRKPDI